jgi:hypothetical protein
MRRLRSGIITAAIAIAASALLSICAWAGTYDYPDKMLGNEGTGPGAIGWMQNADSSWSYSGGRGALTNSWAHIDGYWYYFGADGHMVTGWGCVGGIYYFFTQDTSTGRPLGACVLTDGYDPIIETVGNGPGESFITANPALPYGGSYIDVNITAQTVTVYVGGTTMLQTACVTGNAGTHDTTRGVFTIKSKETARYLQGTNDDGSKYKSFVNFWMPFNGGEGLHDASWRSSFGGTIYQYGGSHGCVNLPYDAAAAIYNTAFVGMTVVVHE